MKFDRRFCRTKQRPRKYGEAQIDRGSIECVDGIVEIEAQVLFGVERTSSADQSLGEIGVYAPIAAFVGFGQRVASDNRGSDTHVIELVLVCSQASLDIAKTLARSQLRKSHNEVLIETTELFDVAFALVTSNTSTKSVHRQVVHHLRKDEFSCVHSLPPWESKEEHAA